MLQLVGAIPVGFRYSLYMARGWESKTADELEERQSELRADAVKAVSQQKRAVADAEQSRARQLLELKRERILSEKTSHPARRAALQGALQDIEAELERLA